MILSRDHTWLRIAALPDNVVERLLKKYPVKDEDGAPLTFDDIKYIEAIFKKHIPGKEDLATEWFLSNMKKDSAYFPSSLLAYAAMGSWFFTNQKEQKFKDVVQEYSERRGQPYNSKNLMDFEGYDLQRLQTIAREMEEAERINKFPETLPSDSDLIYSDGTYRILAVHSAETACALGQGTDWCTATLSTAEDYLTDSPLYVFYRGEDKVAQLHLGPPDESGDAFNVQLMNVKNRSMKVDEGIRKALINSGFMQKIFELAARTSGSEKVLDKFVGTKPNPAIAAMCVGNPRLAYYYADSVLHGRFPAGEKAIARYFYLAMDYARKYMGGRFPAAEPMIVERGSSPMIQYAAMLEQTNKAQYFEFLREHPELDSEFGEVQT